MDRSLLGNTQMVRDQKYVLVECFVTGGTSVSLTPTKDHGVLYKKGRKECKSQRWGCTGQNSVFWTQQDRCAWELTAAEVIAFQHAGAPPQHRSYWQLMVVKGGRVREIVHSRWTISKEWLHTHAYMNPTNWTQWYLGET